jgi:hypothetical protein
MKIISHSFFTFLICLVSLSVNAQDNDGFDKLIINNWTLDSFEVNGEIFPPKEKNKNDQMVFNSDKSAESISAGQIQKGIWSYDKTSRIIKIVDQNNKFEMQLNLISITSSKCVLELENPKGTFIRLNMIAKE